jgi:cupin fold WbuC family metalloprotein
LKIVGSFATNDPDLNVVVFCLNPEIEERIVSQQVGFVKRGGRFFSASGLSLRFLGHTLGKTKRIDPVDDGVFCVHSGKPRLVRSDVVFLKSVASGNNRRRSRICLHPDRRDLIHEMIIALDEQTYVRPHKHLHKSESFHVMEGYGKLILFDDEGCIDEVVDLGDYASGRTFFYRMNDSQVHCVLVCSDSLLLHETTNGPFDRRDTSFPDWAPDEDDTPGQAAFLAQLRKSIDGLRPRQTFLGN